MSNFLRYMTFYDVSYRETPNLWVSITKTFCILPLYTSETFYILPLYLGQTVLIPPQITPSPLILNEHSLYNRLQFVLLELNSYMYGGLTIVQHLTVVCQLQI